MNPEIDPALVSAQAAEVLAQQQQQQQQPVSDAVGAGVEGVVDAAIEVADAGSGILDAVGSIFSIFE